MTALQSNRFRRPGRIWMLLILFTSLSTGEIHGQPPVGSEYQVKAAFIYNFARFTQWPEDAFPSPDSPLILCFIASEPDAEILLALEDKLVRSRRLVVRKLDSDSDSSLDGCHIVYLATGEVEIIRRSLALTRGRAVLSIGQSDAFIRQGGVINFFEREQRLRFAVNLDAADEAGLKFSSQMLMSAEIFQEAP